MHVPTLSKRTTGLAGSIGVAVLAASALSASPASAGIAGSTLVTTTAPDVRSAAVTRFTRDDGLTEQVRVCFDQSITRIGGAQAAATLARFALVGYRSFNPVNPTRVDIGVGSVGTSDSCALLSFPDNTDVRSFTAVTVAGGAVSTSDGTNRLNTPDSITIGSGSDASGPVGRTTGPNLDQVQIDAANNQIIYVTDHDLVRAGNAANNPNAGGFYFINANGVRTNGNAVNVGDNVVTVTFPNANTNPVINARRVGVDAGAVFASNGNGVNGAGAGAEPNSPEQLAVNGGLTIRPAVVAAARATVGNSVLVTYDRPVAVGAQGAYTLFKDTGQGINSSSVQRVTDTQVRVTFTQAGLNRYFSDFVRIQDTGGGVTANDANAQASLPSTGAVGASKSAPGFTSAPDFTSASAANGLVTITTDQAPDDTTAINPANFQLVDSNGQALPFAASSASVSGNQIILEFGTTALIPAVGVSYLATGAGPVFSQSNTAPFDAAVLQTIPFQGLTATRASVRAAAKTATYEAPKVAKAKKSKAGR